MSNVEPSYWGDVLEAILSVACTALDETPAGAPKDCYVSQGRPPGDCCDFLAVWIERFRPTVQFPNEFSNYDNCNIVRQMMDVCITLQRPCFPVLVDNPRSPFPDPALIDTASTDLAFDAQAMWGALTRAYDAGVLFPQPRPVDYIKWGHITPLRVQGGCAGWDFEFTVDLDECA